MIDKDACERNTHELLKTLLEDVPPIKWDEIISSIIKLREDTLHMGNENMPEYQKETIFILGLASIFLKIKREELIKLRERRFRIIDQLER